MPAPHPLASLYAAGPEYAEQARAKLRELLAAHNDDVRATAVDLGIHETTLHDWLTRWGMRDPPAKSSAAPLRKKRASRR